MSEYIEKIIVSDGEQQREIYTLDTDAIVCAVNEMVDGKRAVANALTAINIYTDAGSESLPQIAEKIPNVFNPCFDYAESIEKTFRGQKPTSLTSRFYNDSNIVMFPTIDTSAVTDFSWAFGFCNELRWISPLDLSSVTNTSYMFHSCKKLKYLPPLTLPECAHLYGTFYNCSSLYTVELDVPKAYDISYIFYDCTNLYLVNGLENSTPCYVNGTFQFCSKLSCVYLDFSQVLSAANIFDGCEQLRYLMIYNLGQSICTHYDFSGATAWGSPRGTPDFLLESLLSYSYDRAAASMEPATIILSAETFATLSEEEIAAITAKGFTLTSV